VRSLRFFYKPAESGGHRPRPGSNQDNVKINLQLTCTNCPGRDSPGIFCCNWPVSPILLRSVYRKRTKTATLQRNIAFWSIRFIVLTYVTSVTKSQYLLCHTWFQNFQSHFGPDSVVKVHERVIVPLVDPHYLDVLQNCQNQLTEVVAWPVHRHILEVQDFHLKQLPFLYLSSI
jgi:hypothetical protein